MDNEFVMKTCKPGHKEKTCRYLLVGLSGWECGKTNEKMKKILDGKDDMVARGDNCEGVGNETE